MNDTANEHLSALMDGEAAPGARLEDLLATPHGRATWTRYHLIGDALRDALPARIDTGLAARVSARIAQEPALLAPRRPAPAVLKPLAGLAIAASVAALAIVVFDRGAATTAPGQVPELAVAQRAPAAATAPALAPPVDVVRWTPADPVAAARLNGYLVNYSEQRSTMAVPGVLPPYVRLVGHEER